MYCNVKWRNGKRIYTCAWYISILGLVNDIRTVQYEIRVSRYSISSFQVNFIGESPALLKLCSPLYSLPLISLVSIFFIFFDVCFCLYSCISLLAFPNYAIRTHVLPKTQCMTTTCLRECVVYTNCEKKQNLHIYHATRTRQTANVRHGIGSADSCLESYTSRFHIVDNRR